MITATIAAESGRVMREVSRAGERVTVNLCDTHGVDVRVVLNEKGQLLVEVEHPDPTQITILTPIVRHRAGQTADIPHAQGEQHAQAAGDGSHGPREA